MKLNTCTPLTTYAELDINVCLQAVWNQGMLQSEDVMKAAMASLQKEKATFSKL